MSLTCVLPESAPCTTGSVTDGFFVIFTPADWVLVVLQILSGPQPSVQASLVAELLGVHCPRQVQADDDQEEVGGVALGPLVLDVGDTALLRLGERGDEIHAIRLRRKHG